MFFANNNVTRYAIVSFVKYCIKCLFSIEDKHTIKVLQQLALPSNKNTENVSE